MITVKLDNNEYNYELIKDNNGFDLEEFNNAYTSYFKDFDYIVGDISYSKLRLKGFYSSENKKVRNYNNIDNLDKYIEVNCAYKCKYYVLKKINTSNQYN